MKILRSMYKIETNIWSACQAQLYIQTLSLIARDEIPDILLCMIKS